MKQLFLVALGVLCLCACDIPSSFAMPTSTPTATPLPQSTDVAGCISSEPTQSDIDRALGFADKVIDPTEWKRSYTVSDNRVAVTWMDAGSSAIAYIETLIFPCGYDETSIDQYFTDANWKTIFQNYDAYEETHHCSAKGLRLYEFSARNQGQDYNIHFWAQDDTDVRVITLMLVFPVSASTQLDSYSSRLFPNLRSCA